MKMMKALKRRPQRGFTLIELLVSVTISVILLSILALVFQISTRATRNANTRISLTERMRALNIRMRQEIGNMLDKERPAHAKPGKPGPTYWPDPSGKYIIFSTATDEDGRPVNVDVKYEFVLGKEKEDGKLIRRRDATGPYVLDADGEVAVKTTGTPPVQLPTINTKYTLGYDEFFQDGFDGNKSAPSTVMMANVRSVKFRVIDPPLEPDDPILKTQLNPRTLPAAIEMEIQYGPETGATDQLEWAKIVFPVYRGL